MPWPLFQHLVALADGRGLYAAASAPEDGISADDAPPASAPAAEPQDAPRRFSVIVNDAPPVSAQLWDSAFGPGDGFDDMPGLLGDRFSPDVLERLMDGDHPVKVFRESRGLTQRELAERAGINATYLSQIETRNRGGSTRVYRRLAAVLDVNLDDLIE